MNIAIASGKGGTGKTTLSTNLASYLAETTETVLVDLDVEEPNSALFFSDSSSILREDKFKKIPHWDAQKCNNCGKCKSYCNFNALVSLGKEIIVFPELCHSCYACSDLCEQDALPMQDKKMGVLTHSSNGNLSFVESRLDVGQEQSVALISQTIDYVMDNFSIDSIKIFDSPPGTSCPVVEVLKNADYVILVTEPTPFGLHDLSIAVETVRLLKKDFGLVINRYGIGNDELIDYCNKENIEIISKIANSRIIAELYSQAKLLYPIVDEFKYQIEIIANHIIQMKGEKR